MRPLAEDHNGRDQVATGLHSNREALHITPNFPKERGDRGQTLIQAIRRFGASRFQRLTIINMPMQIMLVIMEEPP